MTDLQFDYESRSARYVVTGAKLVELPDGRGVFPDTITIDLIGKPDAMLTVEWVTLRGAKALANGKKGKQAFTGSVRGDELSALPRWVQDQIKEETG